jgi:hypothetical protein
MGAMSVHRFVSLAKKPDGSYRPSSLALAAAQGVFAIAFMIAVFDPTSPVALAFFGTGGAILLAMLIAMTAAEVSISLGANVNFPEDPATFVSEIPTFFPDYDFDQPVHGPTPEDAIESLRPYIDAGVTRFQINPEDLRSLRIFATEVAPVLGGSA